ncbi:class II aldolase/adducin family protein [Aquipseudomonas guryensis]|jgi:L-fuculose-phosphate aldolase|uniref:Class II aldolase/adducin family protein n=1 Tax=Aquipseudomonas guryensis TaxID=2759165 RepID=A0A7W4DDB2_9GAMM|nr:class II aldolase/adducin family protein [Pseudomonas guryensis]MBB1520517.1 class II aldolase/adducin family protein [Pseudomonas guryensis]
MNLTQQACEQVVRTAVALADQGFLAGVGGNLALRIDAEHFAVTPSASDYYAMAPDDICVLRLSDLKQLAGHGKPSVESGLHACMFKARPDCRASVHTHQPVASAFTLLDRPLPISDEHARRLIGGDVPVCAYAPSGTGWLASNVGKRVRFDLNAYLMRNHGAVCLGASLDDACRVVQLLEQEAVRWFQRALAAQPANRQFQQALAALNS